MAPSRKPPLWARVLDDPNAREWIKKHRAEFPQRTFLPDDTAFKEKSSSYQRFLAEVITDLLPTLTGDDHKIAKLYLRTHPSEIARLLKWDRKEVYLAIRRLKRAAMRHFKKQRESQLNQRTDNLELDTHPERVAVRTVSLTLHNVEKHAFLVNRDGETVWVDEAGAVFANDVQEILHDLAEHEGGFEVLDAKAGA